MRRLLLLRHAKTETNSPSGRDQDRRLDDRGRIDAAEIGDWIGRHLPLPDFVLISPAARTRQTWELAWDAMKQAAPPSPAEPPHVEWPEELYGADPAQLMESIHAAAVTNPKRLMVVAHNPGMHELALMLPGSGDAAARSAVADNLPTSGLAVVDFATEDWSDVVFGQGRLVLFASPKLLKQQSGG